MHALIEEVLVDADEHVVGEHAEEDVGLDPMLQVMEDRPLHERTLHVAEGVLDAGEEDVQAPDLVLVLGVRGIAGGRAPARGAGACREISDLAGDGKVLGLWAALKGGITNANFVVTDRGRRHFVRIGDESRSRVTDTASIWQQWVPAPHAALGRRQVDRDLGRPRREARVDERRGPLAACCIAQEICCLRETCSMAMRTPLWTSNIPAIPA